jgi:hypothetical protein
VFQNFCCTKENSNYTFLAEGPAPTVPILLTILVPTLRLQGILFFFAEVGAWKAGRLPEILDLQGSFSRGVVHDSLSLEEMSLVNSH